MMKQILLRILAAMGLVCPLGQAAFAQPQPEGACLSFQDNVEGKATVIDLRASTGGASSPYIYRLSYDTFTDKPSDGYFGAITGGKMTFSYPRQNNPIMPYKKDAPYPRPFTYGPAYGDVVDYQARQLGCNLFEVHWKEPKRGDAVTHIEDFGRAQICTNISSLNRVPVPEAFDPLDLANRLDSKRLFPHGSPAEEKSFGWTNVCGKIERSPIAENVWENVMHYQIYHPR